MEYFYPLIGKCALTKPEEQGGGRQILYQELGKAAEPGQGRDTGDSLLRLVAAGRRWWQWGRRLGPGMAPEGWGSFGWVEELQLMMVQGLRRDKKALFSPK